MTWLKATLLAPLMRFGESLKFPWLFLVTAVLFGLDLLLPDFIPFIDEILLGLATLLLGSLRKRRKSGEISSTENNHGKNHNP